LTIEVLEMGECLMLRLSTQGTLPGTDQEEQEEDGEGLEADVDRREEWGDLWW
jgi:hypothetical protein